MNIDANLFFVGLLFWGVVFVYFSYARKQAKPFLLICGLVLMVYPYFVGSALWSGLIGGCLTALPILLRWF